MPPRDMKKQAHGAFVGVAVVGIGSFVTTPSIGNWYAGTVSLARNSSNLVFGPVWIVLFALMGVTALLVWEKRYERPVGKALMIFSLQLALNILWSISFFCMYSKTAAFFEIIFLWLAILWTIIAFRKVNRVAAALIVPYLVWVTYAAYINYAIMVSS
jgi:tryptophan-rich sensory protein